MKKFFTFVIVAIIAVGVAKFLGGVAGRQAAERHLAASDVKTQGTDQIAPLVTAITVQDTEGTSESDMDLDALKKLEQHMVQTILTKARANYAKQGFDPKTYNPQVDVGSVYTISGGKKLAVIKMTVDSQVRTVSIMGFNGGQFLRVTCIRGSNHDIPVFSGECGQKVTEAFGVSLKPSVAASEATKAEAPQSGGSNTDRLAAAQTPKPAPLPKGDASPGLIEAARNGDLRTVRALVASGANVNARSPMGFSALSGAAGKGHTEVVKFLLENGVNVNEKLRFGTNALDQASFWGHVSTVELLLAKGADVNIRKDESNGYTPLLSAVDNGHISIAKILLERGAQVNARDSRGSTALHSAALQKNDALIQLLLKHGADPSIKNAGGYSYTDLLNFKQ